MKRGEAAHRQSNNVRAVDAEMIEYRADVVGGAALRIGGLTFRHVGGRIAPRVEPNAAVPLAEMPHLELPAPMIASELMHEDHRLSGTCLLIIQTDSIFGHSVRHAKRLFAFLVSQSGLGLH